MRERKAFEKAPAARGKTQEDDARIGIAANALDESLALEAAAKFHGAVVMNLQAFGQRTDGRREA
ncbi:MAG TPA: hypothetical protein VMB02_04025 [Candidatus Aquilonibacter sp.]|nr:hypothetical protein [Candidatus Aquilonibacter sp.]